MSAAANKKLGAKWQLNASMLSSPADLSALVTLSQTSPDEFFKDDTLHVMVSKLLNNSNEARSDKDTKLDVLAILANLAARKDVKSRESVRQCLMGVSEWFDAYMEIEESAAGQEPELHKSMLLLLTRAWDYRIKTEDLLELTRGDRRLALETVVGVIEDGETYSTELVQRQKPREGQVGQWEHEVVCRRHEKPLLLQLCRLVRGFTHPTTYFREHTSAAGSQGDGEDLALYSVDEFSGEMDGLLDIVLRTRVLEKLPMALYDCLFASEEQRRAEEEEEELVVEGHMLAGSAQLEEADHQAIHSIHCFIQNLYNYATRSTDVLQSHLLSETVLVPRLILPYLDMCMRDTVLLSGGSGMYEDEKNEQNINISENNNNMQNNSKRRMSTEAQVALEPVVAQGVASSLRTLVIASFRAPANKFMLGLLRRLNPTASLLRVGGGGFIARHEYIFALLCLLNINMGALDLNSADGGEMEENEELWLEPDDGEEGEAGFSDGGLHAYYAHALLHDLAAVFQSMSGEAQQRILRRVLHSGALPVSRDTPSYAAVMSILYGGGAGQSDYLRHQMGTSDGEAAESKGDDDTDIRNERKALKEESSARARKLSSNAGTNTNKHAHAEAKSSSNQRRNSGETKESKSGAKGERRLLGDLPALGKKVDQAALQDLKQQRLRVSLGLRDDDVFKLQPQQENANNKAPIPPSASDVPAEFLCAINGHMMKQPVRSPHGHSFEASTIELWLETRGQVCPLTGKPLLRGQLVPDDELRTRIIRWHIQKTAMRSGPSIDGDDVYDF